MIYIVLIALLVLIEHLFGGMVAIGIVMAYVVYGLWYWFISKEGREKHRQLRAEEKERVNAKRLKKEQAYALRLKEAKEQREYWEKFKAEKPELYAFLLKRAQEKEWAQQQADNDEWFWFWSNW